MGQNQPGQGCYLIRRVKTCSSPRTNITSRLWSQILIEKILSARDKFPKIHQRFRNFWWIILHATYESLYMSHTKYRSYDQCFYLRSQLKLKFHHCSNPVGGKSDFSAKFYGFFFEKFFRSKERAKKLHRVVHPSLKPVGVSHLTQPHFRNFCTILKNIWLISRGPATILNHDSWFNRKLDRGK